MGDFLIHYNHNHDPNNGRFTFGSGGRSGTVKRKNIKTRTPYANFVTFETQGIASLRKQKQQQRMLDELRELAILEETDRMLEKDGLVSHLVDDNTYNTYFNEAAKKYSGKKKRR